MDQRARQQSSHRQVIDTSRSVDTSLKNEFRQSGESSKVFDIGSSSSVSRKGVFSNDLFGLVGDTRTAESGSRIKIQGYGNELETWTETNFTKDVCVQTN